MAAIEDNSETTIILTASNDARNYIYNNIIHLL